MTCPIDRDEFPRLAGFLREYVNGDCPSAHGGLAAAAAAFRESVGGASWAQLREEWRRFAEVTGAMPFEETCWLLVEELGSRWQPADVAELEQLALALGGEDPVGARP
jgi:hypothetical protein